MIVFKYPLELINWQKIDLPVDSKILTAQIRNGKICLWAEVSTSKLEPVLIKIVATGHKDIIEEWDEYIGTVQDADHVLHIYRGQLRR